MWDHMTARSLVHLQRLAALRALGEEAKRLHDEGYTVDADRVLDEMLERKRAWQEEMHASS